MDGFSVGAAVYSGGSGDQCQDVVVAGGLLTFGSQVDVFGNARAAGAANCASANIAESCTCSANATVIDFDAGIAQMRVCASVFVWLWTV